MRRMIQSNLIKNSIAAYFALVEIHNKPNIAYRYETVTLLMMNAWELALKAYVRKYIKRRSIFTNKNYTISFDKALDYVNEDINAQKSGSFIAIRENLLCIEEYRNKIAHYYCDELEPYIFMLIAKAALNYVEFMEQYFKKNIMESDGLFIMPLGFKLPFDPKEFLSHNVAKYAASPEAQHFIDHVVNVISSLNEQGIEDSIVLGFDVMLNSVKKVSNSDLMVAISSDGEGIPIARTVNYRYSPDANQTVKFTETQFRNIWPFSHDDLVEWCKENIPDFKQSNLFHEAKRKAEKQGYVYVRRLDDKNEKSTSKKYYSLETCDFIKSYFENLVRRDSNGKNMGGS